MTHEADPKDIAVIGMAGRFPGARDLRQFWENLKNGVEAVTFFSDQELRAAGVPEKLLKDQNYVKAGSILEGIEHFDAPFFGYTAREAEILDPQQRLFLECAWQALEQAAVVPENYPGTIGVYAGVAWNTYLLSNLTTRLDLFEGAGAFQVFITNDKDFMPTRLSYKLNLKGPSVLVQTSCSTSLVAVHLAGLGLVNYECDLALVGGVTVKVPQVSGYYYQEGGLASPDGHCRAFDAQAAGTIFGSGIGCVVLKRLEEALEDGDPVLAVIKGSAINNDGSVKVSYTAPSVEGQAEVIGAAQALADIDPESLGYIEAHGTGTSLGDPIEVTALKKVFAESTQKKGFCALGSVKSNLGHLDAAAGVAGFIKTVLTLQHGQIPPSLHFEQPNPAIDFESSPFYVNAALRDWPVGDSPRRAAVSSFGVGGTNAHVILEQAREQRPSGPSRPWQLLCLSARTESALEAATANLADSLQGQPDTPLADVAYTLHTARSVFRQRRFLVAQDRQQAIQALRGQGGRLFNAADLEEPRNRPVIFQFSGQGTQHPGMTRRLYESEPVFREEFDRCATILLGHLELDLREEVFGDGEGFRLQAPGSGFQNPESELLNPEPGTRNPESGSPPIPSLTATSLAQPALFAVEYALARLWMSWGIEPQGMIGHSIGEYVAACLSGVFTLEEALALVAARGRLMQQQPPGVMLAVPLPESKIEQMLGAELSLAAVNEPSRVVVSGPEGAVGLLEERLSKQGVAGRRLVTSHAFHSAMMDPILEEFRSQVSRVSLQPPRIPFISNRTGTWITAQQATDPGYWVEHLRQSVRYADGVAELFSQPERVLLEVGPGRTLTTLASRHPSRQGQPVIASLPDSLKEDSDDFASLLSALGSLWMAGLQIDWTHLYDSQQRRRIALPSYPFEPHRYWIDPLPRGPAAVAAHGQGIAKRPDQAEWFYLPCWKPSLPLAKPAERTSRRWLVFAAGEAGERLVERLRQAGNLVTAVRMGKAYANEGDSDFILNPAQAEDYNQLIEHLSRQAKQPEAVVHTWSLSHSDGPAADNALQFETYQQTAFYSLLYLVQALIAKPDQPLDLTVLTECARPLSPEEDFRPEAALLAGLCTVLPQEHPHITCRCIELRPEEMDSDYLPEYLNAEAEAGSSGTITYRASERFTTTYEPVRLEAQADSPAFREDGVYLLMGALEGNGLALAKLLARRQGLRLALIEDSASDSQLDAQQRSIRLDTLRRQGAEILPLRADIADPAQLSQAFAEVRQRFGALHGIIHAAGTQGVETFGAIREMTHQDCLRHFRPKAQALYALREAVADQEELEFCILISSLASVLGGLAYGAYTAANRFMDAFALRQKAFAGPRWLSVDWDVWQLEDEPEQITSLRRDLADLAMTAEEGEEVFERIVARGLSGQLVLSTADLASRIADSRRRSGSQPGGDSSAAQTSLHSRPDLPNPYAPPEDDLERDIAEVWQAVLGFESIGVYDNFFELGGDSFLAIQVASRLQDKLEIELPVARLYQGVTVRLLAELISQDAAKAQQRAAHLQERRQSMSRRKDFLKKRRTARRGRSEVQ